MQVSGLNNSFRGSDLSDSTMSACKSQQLEDYCGVITSFGVITQHYALGSESLPLFLNTIMLGAREVCDAREF